ncbi:hypothetical protein AAG906_017151 [Vitis piasezkii]
MKRVLRYLKGIVNHELFYTPSPLQLHTYCDSWLWSFSVETRFLEFQETNVVSRSSTSRVPFNGTCYN